MSFFAVFINAHHFLYSSEHIWVATQISVSWIKIPKTPYKLYFLFAAFCIAWSTKYNLPRCLRKRGITQRHRSLQDWFKQRGRSSSSWTWGLSSYYTIPHLLPAVHLTCDSKGSHSCTITQQAWWCAHHGCFLSLLLLASKTCHPWWMLKPYLPGPSHLLVSVSISLNSTQRQVSEKREGLRVKDRNDNKMKTLIYLSCTDMISVWPKYPQAVRILRMKSQHSKCGGKSFWQVST